MRKPRGTGRKRKKPDYTKFSTSNRMTRFLNSLETGKKKVFCTRDCLDYGTRASVDKALSRMVKAGDLVRIARGVFMLNHPWNKVPSIDEIATIKATAFKRRILTHGVNCLKDYFDFEHPATERSYATDGATSSFWSKRGRVKLKSYAPRKLKLADSPAGKLIRALWHFRNPKFASVVWCAIREYMGRLEREVLRNSGAIIPTWLVNIVKYNMPVDDVLPPELEALWESMKLRIAKVPAGPPTWDTE